mmetsp:Transcript_8149/g.20235  ORF Transcript_8149/g.20235 Transcript_8149/m.20235 type:complete len:213 (-) Transcript_8149:231-869(-)
MLASKMSKEIQEESGMTGKNKRHKKYLYAWIVGLKSLGVPGALAIRESSASARMSSSDATSHSSTALKALESAGEEPEKERTVEMRSESARRLSLQQSTQLLIANEAPVESSGMACSRSPSLSGAGILRTPAFPGIAGLTSTSTRSRAGAATALAKTRGFAAAMRADSARSAVSCVRLAWTAECTRLSSSLKSSEVRCRLLQRRLLSSGPKL